MTGLILLDIGNVALGTPLAHDTTCGPRGHGSLGMVGNKEVLVGIGTEALATVPGHVLDREQGAIVNQDVVQIAVANHSSLEVRYDPGQNLNGRWQRVISNESFVGARRPACWWGIDRGLHIRAVEIDVDARGHVVDRAGEAEGVEEQRAICSELVDIEAGIHQSSGSPNISP